MYNIGDTVQFCNLGINPWEGVIAECTGISDEIFTFTQKNGNFGKMQSSDLPLHTKLLSRFSLENK